MLPAATAIEGVAGTEAGESAAGEIGRCHGASVGLIIDYRRCGGKKSELALGWPIANRPQVSHPPHIAAGRG